MMVLLNLEQVYHRYVSVVDDIHCNLYWAGIKY